MSQPDPSNPYQSPQGFSAAAAPAKPLPPVQQTALEYMRAYNYIFENPEWMTVLLWGALMSFIPVVGPLVLLGYMFVVIDSLLQTQGTRYPVLDLNKFVDYLVRGLWPFLVSLVVSLVLMPIFLVLWFAVTIIPMAIAGAGGEDAGPVAGIVMLVLMLFMMVFVMALTMGLNIVMFPLLLRAGLAQDFAEAFNFAWIKDFVRKMWLDTLLAVLFLMITSLVLVMLGYCACFIGVFVAQPIVLMAYAHILYQLYAIYLTRGGTPVFAKAKPGSFA
jgi:hypothetical protein